MDVMLEKGDFVTDVTGRPLYIDGIEEVLQRVKFSLSTHKGDFVYNKDFGCETPILTPDERCLKNVEAQLREALVNIRGVRIDILSAKALEEGLLVQFDLAYGGQRIKSEVVVK